jgi:hypothetical protein
VDDPTSGNRLEFNFDIYRTQLSQISESLEHFLAAFPVVAAPDD